MTQTSAPIQVDEAQARVLLATCAPEWAQLDLRAVRSTGTDNAIFRLGESSVLRIPRRADAVALLEKELDWLPRLNALPLGIPVLHARGRSEQGQPFGILDWIAGRNATPDQIADPLEAARQLAACLGALQKIETRGAPAAGALNSRRGVPLADLHEVTSHAIDTVADEIDAPRAHALWENACAAAPAHAARWVHGDLKADNLIAQNGKLRGVIDWGLAAVGDPAADYAAAWSWVSPEARAAFRDRLGAPETDWLRARGWALYGAVIALSYYRGGRNEALCRQSRLTLSRLGLLR